MQRHGGNRNRINYDCRVLTDMLIAVLRAVLSISQAIWLCAYESVFFQFGCSTALVNRHRLRAVVEYVLHCDECLVIYLSSTRIACVLIC